MANDRPLDDRPLVLIHDAPAAPFNVEAPAVLTVTELGPQVAHYPQRRRDARRTRTKPQIAGGCFAARAPYRADEDREHENENETFHVENS
jgi:hypothetical protein